MADGEINSGPLVFEDPDGTQFDTPEKAFAQAQRLIADAISNYRMVLIFHLRNLERIPLEVASMTNLFALSLQGTRVIDIAPIARNKSLKHLLLGHTGVEDIAPLAQNTELQLLMLDNTRVSDLSPLAANLKLIDGALRHGNGSPTDKDARHRLIGWPSDRYPGISLGSFYPLTLMVNRPEFTTLGLSFAHTPASRQLPFRNFASLKQPGRTIETINHLRRQQGLSEWADGGPQQPPYDPLLDLPEPTNVPSQVRPALNFGGPYDGPIGLTVPTGEQVLDTPAQRDFYEEIKDKARALADQISGAQNNRLADIRRGAERLLEPMGRTLNELEGRRFWSRMNTLRRRLEADSRSREAPDPDTPPLPEAVAGLLEDLIDTCNVFAVGDPLLSEIDQQSLDPSTRLATRALLRAAHELAQAVTQTPRAVTREAADALLEISPQSLDAAPSDERNNEFAIRSSRNLVTEMLRRLAVAGGSIGGAVYRATGWLVEKTASNLAGNIGTTVIAEFVVKHQLVISAVIQGMPGEVTLRKILETIVRIAR